MPLNNNGENFRGGGELEIEEMKFNGKKCTPVTKIIFFHLPKLHTGDMKERSGNNMKIKVHNQIA